jgi:hypothetical protein
MDDRIGLLPENTATSTVAHAARSSRARKRSLAPFVLAVAIWDLNAGRIGTGYPNLIFLDTRLRLP